MEKKKKHLLNFLLFVPGIALIAWSIYILAQKKPDISSLALSAIPNSTTELSGREFRKKDLSGKLIFLEFRDHNSPPIDDFLAQWSHYSKLAIILVHMEPPDQSYAEFPAIHSMAGDGVNTRYIKIGSFYLFDFNGRIVEKGPTRSGYDQLKIALLKYLKNDIFDPCSLISHSAWISDLISKQRKKYVLVSLFSDFCSSCRTGRIIERLKNIEKNRKSGIAIIGVLNSNYFSPSDFPGLLSQSGIEFPLYISPNDIASQWQFLAKKYSKQVLDGVLFLYQNGNLIKSADASCFCDDEVFMFLESIGRKNEI